MKDPIERQAVIDLIHGYFCGVIDSDESPYIDARILTHSKRITKAIRELPPVTRDPDEFCHDCKEYDAERHSCPRFNQVIRRALDEAKEGKQ